MESGTPAVAAIGVGTGRPVAAPSVDPGRRRRVPRGEIQRQVILDAYESLLGEMSAIEITVKDITDTAGIKRPNFYFYFESKDEVLAELVRQAWEAWDKAIGSYHRLAGESSGDHFDRLFRVSHSVWVERGRAIVAGIEATGYDEKLRVGWSALDAELNAQLAEQMTRDAEAGLIEPASDDHRRLVETLTDMITYAFYKDRRALPAAEESVRMLDTLKAVWLRSWGAPDSSE